MSEKVVMFICHQALGALEMARERGLELQPSFAVVEVPCSGRVDEITILRALRHGAAGVLVVGCLLGNCRFQTGNYEARRKVEEVKRMLEEIGVKGERVEMVNIAPIQYQLLLERAEGMASLVRRLGPIRLTEGTG